MTSSLLGSQLGRLWAGLPFRWLSESAFGSVDIAASYSPDTIFTRLSLPLADFSLETLSAPFELAPRSVGGITVAGWRDGFAETSQTAAGADAGPLSSFRDSSSSAGIVVRQIAADAFALDASGAAEGRSLQSSPNHFAIHDMDAGVLLQDEQDVLDFDQLHFAPEETLVAGQGELNAAMLLPEGFGGARLDIGPMVAESHVLASAGSDPAAADGLGRIEASLIFESAPAPDAEPMEFTAFDNSLPTPIMASIEWGG